MPQWPNTLRLRRAARNRDSWKQFAESFVIHKFVHYFTNTQIHKIVYTNWQIHKYTLPSTLGLRRAAENRDSWKQFAKSSWNFRPLIRNTMTVVQYHQDHNAVADHPDLFSPTFPNLHLFSPVVLTDLTLHWELAIKNTKEIWAIIKGRSLILAFIFF